MQSAQCLSHVIFVIFLVFAQDFVLVFIFQAESSGKSQMAIDKMVEGRLRKYFEDVVLMDQKFVMNDTMKVK
ncbi:elongation factor Ts mitochondrial-like, partial [Trifolium pratense]